MTLKTRIRLRGNQLLTVGGNYYTDTEELYTTVFLQKVNSGENFYNPGFIIETSIVNVSSMEVKSQDDLPVIEVEIYEADFFFDSFGLIFFRTYGENETDIVQVYPWELAVFYTVPVASEIAEDNPEGLQWHFNKFNYDSNFHFNKLKTDVNSAAKLYRFDIPGDEFDFMDVGARRNFVLGLNIVASIVSCEIYFASAVSARRKINPCFDIIDSRVGDTILYLKHAVNPADYEDFKGVSLLLLIAEYNTEE